MPEIQAGPLALLRADDHIITPYLSVLKPRTLWTARVNSVSLEQGSMSIAFDGGAGSNFSWIEAHQEVWVGTVAGADDLGRARIRGITSGDSGVTGTVSVARSPIRWVNDAYLTFIHDYPLKPLRPRIGGDETFYKDYDITFDWPPTPVCIAGPHRAQFLVGSSLVFAVDLSGSYAIAAGATIASFTASITPSSGTTVSVNAGTGIGTITFTAAGQYWAKFSCTDSNGKVETTFRCYIIASPDPDSSHYPITSMELTEIDGTWEGGGWESSFTLYDGPTLADVPDGTLAILWGEWRYGDSQTPITFLPNNNPALVVGYIRQDTFSKDMGTGEQPVKFKMTTANGVLDQKYNFSISLEAVSGTPDVWWKYDDSLTVGRGLHHLFALHTTALKCMDIIGLTDVVTPRAYVEMADSTLYAAGSSLARDKGTRQHLVCDRGGRMYLTSNSQLLRDGPRASLPLVGTLTTTDRSLLEVNREQEDQVAFVHVSGFVWDKSFDAEGAPDAQAVCAVAPGDDAADGGPRVERMEYQTFTDQGEADDVAGRVWSAANNRFKDLEVTFHGNYLGVSEVAYGERWQISLLTTETPREIVLTERDMYVRNVRAIIQDGSLVTIVNFEAEAPPAEGKPTDCPTLPYIGGDWDFPEEEDLEGALITAGSVKFKSPVGSSWATRYANTVSDMMVDPYWQAKQDSAASESAIVIIGGPGYVRRTVDAGKNWTVITPSTDPPNIFGDSPAPTAGDLDYAIIEPSEAVESEWVAIGRWQNASDEWRSWIVYTADDFATTRWEAGGAGGSSTVSVDEHNLVSNDVGEKEVRIITLNATDSVVFYLAQGPPPDLRLMLHARVIRVGATITMGTPTPLGDDADVQTHSATRLSSTRVMAVYRYDPIGDSNRVKVLNLTISDLEIVTIGGNTTVSTDLWGKYLTLVGLTDTKAVMFASIQPSSAFAITPGYRSIVINTDGTTGIGTIGSEYVARNAEQIIFSTGYAISDSQVLVAYGLRSGTSLFSFTLYLHLLSVSGNTITEHTPAVAAVAAGGISLTSASCCEMSSSKGLLVGRSLDISSNYYTSAWVFSISGNSISVETEQELSTPSADPQDSWVNPTVSKVSQTRAIVSYVPDRDPYTMFSSSLVVNLSSGSVSVDGAPVYSALNAGVKSPMQAIVAGSLLIAYLSPAISASVGDLDLYYAGGVSLGKVIGASVGKAEGFYLYLTSWAGGEIILQVYELPAVTLIDAVFMTTATEEQLSSRSRIAFPYSPWGFSDDFVWIYGRMQDPGGLSGLAHIIYSANAGLTYVVLEDSYGAAHCSSLAERYGTIQAIVSLGTVSKLYLGGLSGGMALKSTLPIVGYVWPHGTAYDWYNQIIYVATGVDGAVVVVKSADPYLEWTDITYDHGPTAVKSIEVL